MRTALLMCGQPRTMEFCFPSQKQHILDVYQPDVFVCSDEQEDRLRELYKPVSIVVKDNESIFNLACEMRASQTVLPPINLSIAWKVFTANQLKEKYEAENELVYDLVFLSRFDVKFAKVPVITQVEPDTFYTPRMGAYWRTSANSYWISPENEPGVHWHGYSSHLCYGSSPVMSSLAGMYFDPEDSYGKACESNQEYGFVPEYVLKHYCDHRFKHELFEVNMMLIRGTSEHPLSYDNQSLDQYEEYK